MNSESNPFQIRSSQTVYDNPWIQLVEYQVINPAGRPGIYGVIKFKNRAVGVIPYENGSIWLVGQYRFPLEIYSWEIPKGGVPFTESLASGASRELQEETGLSASSVELILEMHLSNSVSDEAAAVFLARNLKGGPAHPEETEQLQMKQVTLFEAYEMVKSGKITDVLSVSAILKLIVMKYEGKLD